MQEKNRVSSGGRKTGFRIYFSQNKKQNVFELVSLKLRSWQQAAYKTKDSLYARALRETAWPSVFEKETEINGKRIPSFYFVSALIKKRAVFVYSRKTGNKR